MTKLIGILALLFFSSCSLAPFSNVNSARSLKEGKSQIDLGVSASGLSYYGNLGFGFTEKLDFGAIIEAGPISNTGAWSRYSFINNAEGLSIAAIGSIGYGYNTNYIYAGPVISYRFNKFELYGVFRYNIVSINENEFDIGDEYEQITIKSLKPKYLSSTLGLNYHIDTKWILNTNATIITDRDLANSDFILFGFGISMNLN